jgi:hypothetical protein
MPCSASSSVHVFEAFVLLMHPLHIHTHLQGTKPSYEVVQLAHTQEVEAILCWQGASIALLGSVSHSHMYKV